MARAPPQRRRPHLGLCARQPTRYFLPAEPRKGRGIAAALTHQRRPAQVIFAIVSVVKTITRKKAHRITTQARACCRTGHPGRRCAAALSSPRAHAHPLSHPPHRPSAHLLPLSSGPHHGHGDGYGVMEATGQAVLPQVAAIWTHLVDRPRPERMMSEEAAGEST